MVLSSDFMSGLGSMERGCDLITAGASLIAWLKEGCCLDTNSLDATFAPDFGVFSTVL